MSEIEDQARAALYELQSRVERLEGALQPFSDEELQDAKEPHPHAFGDGVRGLLPVGEVTVLAAPGREGKTFASVALSVSYVLGTQVAGLLPQRAKSVVIYSAEDDRAQYARKLLAVMSQLGAANAATVRERIIVPDLSRSGMEPFQSIVTMIERQVIESSAVDAVIDALSGKALGLVVFETASTLSEADEGNREFRILIRALRRIARSVGAAVLLVHHTSQAAAQNLPDLNVSVADVRGATALAFNARQVALLVNLGGEADPFPDGDARTLLRRMALPHASERVTAWITLDTSKAENPAPVFFKWQHTAYGPALSVAPIASTLQGASWRNLQRLIKGQRAEVRQARKDEVRDSKVGLVVNLAKRLHQEGKHPTARAISTAAGHNPGWAMPYLAVAVEDGDLTRAREQVPRVKGDVDVYRPVNPLEDAA